MKNKKNIHTVRTVSKSNQPHRWCS